MNNLSRTQNSKRNILLSVANQILTILLSFASRTVFIYFLGAEYLGLNGLFSNILSVLSLSELGISSAMTFSMYKPLADGNKQSISALITFYKKLYSIVGAVIAALGLTILPFLSFIVNGEEQVSNIHIYYLLFLANSVSSYFFTYKTSVIIADQKEYTLKVLNMAAAAATFVIQYIVLLIMRSFAAYLIVQLVVSVALNAVCAAKAERMYPYIKEKQELPSEEKRTIFDNVKSFFAYHLGSVVLNNIDNILISILINTITVGIYSNYNLIITKISSITQLFFTSIQSSIGNLNTDASAERKYDLFKLLCFVQFWIYGFCSICFCVLFQDFIVLWLGENFLIDKVSMYMGIATFYIQGYLYPIWCFRNTTGLFRQAKYIMLPAAAINLVLSIIMGIKFGLAGILAATVIARLLTNMWFEPYTLFKKYFFKPVSRYFIKQFLQVLLVIGIIFIIEFGFSFAAIDSPILLFSAKLIVCLIVPNGIFFIMFRKTDEFKTIIKKIMH